MSNSSAPQSINSQIKALQLSSIAKKSISLSPEPGKPVAVSPDRIEISPNAREIGHASRAERLDQMSPEELLDFTHDVFSKFDQNGDGEISQREAASLGVNEETFQYYDRNGDGRVGLREEFAPTLLKDLRNAGMISFKQWALATKELGGTGAVLHDLVNLFNRIDADGDKSVSFAEASEFGVSREEFEKWDQDGNGTVGFLEEYMPRIADELKNMGVLDRGEYGNLMERIKNALGGERERPEGDVIVLKKPEENRRAERPELRREDREIRFRERAEEWLRGRHIGTDSLRDLRHLQRDDRRDR